MSNNLDTFDPAELEALVRELLASQPPALPRADLAARAVRQSQRVRTAVAGGSVLAVAGVVAAAGLLSQAREGSVPPASTSTSPPGATSSASASPSPDPTASQEKAPAQPVSIGDRVPIPAWNVVLVVTDDGFCIEGARGMSAAERADNPAVGECRSAADTNGGLGVFNKTVGGSSGSARYGSVLSPGLAVDQVESLEAIQDGKAYPATVLAPRGKSWRIYYLITPLPKDEDLGKPMVVNIYDAAGQPIPW